MPTTDERLEALERMAKSLEAQGKALMMINGAAFAAMAENPEALRLASESLQVSIRAAAQEHAHPVVAAQLRQAATLLEGLLRATR